MRNNPAREPTSSTVLYAVHPNANKPRYTLVLVDDGVIVGGITLKAGKTHVQVTASNAIQSWGPTLYKAAFQWAKINGFKYVYSDTTVFQDGITMWNRFFERGMGEASPSKSLGKFRMPLDRDFLAIPVRELSREEYEEYGPKILAARGVVGNFPYNPLGDSLEKYHPVEWPAGPYGKPPVR